MATESKLKEADKGVGVEVGVYNAAVDLGFLLGPALGAFMVTVTSMKVMLYSFPTSAVLIYLGALLLSHWRKTTGTEIRHLGIE